MISDLCDFLQQLFLFRLYPQHRQQQIMRREAEVPVFIREATIGVVNGGIPLEHTHLIRETLLSFSLSHIAPPGEQLVMTRTGLVICL